ncbi:hypothetical protein CWI37_0240p0010 [Hamiltosporidium tvaerminnensis]|uniref:Leucine-rich repeat-containing protein n=1 Tax=Hamiltosporidium tvaerminnensis TaxID=1176355 RepID=A0A4Q9L7V8_9MICR|nr:hypothetical protein CWI37_0240p0010 [Hamiltosporidium tvaerminnensis]
MKNRILINYIISLIFFIVLECSNLLTDTNIIHIYDITNERRLFKGFNNYIFLINFMIEEISIFKDTRDIEETEHIYKLFSENINIISNEIKRILAFINCNTYSEGIGIKDICTKYKGRGDIENEEDCIDLSKFVIKIISVELKRDMEYFVRLLSVQDFSFCNVNILIDIIYWIQILDIPMDFNLYRFFKLLIFNLIDSNEFVKEYINRRDINNVDHNINTAKESPKDKTNTNSINYRFDNNVYNLILLYEFLKNNITDKNILHIMFEFESNTVIEFKNNNLIICNSFIRFTDDILFYVLDLLKVNKFRKIFSYLLTMCQIPEIIFNFINFRSYIDNLNLLIDVLPESIEKISLNDVENTEVLFLHLKSTHSKQNIKRITIFDRKFLLPYVFYLRDFLNIEEIRILSVNKSTNDFDCLNIIDHIFAHLKVLYLSVRWLPDTNFFKIVSDFKSLTDFYLSINIFISYNDFLTVLVNLFYGNFLKSLKICIFKTNITNIFIYLKFFNKLENICLECNETNNSRSFTHLSQENSFFQSSNHSSSPPVSEHLKNPSNHSYSQPSTNSSQTSNPLQISSKLNHLEYFSIKKLEFVNLRLNKKEYLFLFKLPNLSKLTLKHCHIQDFDIKTTILTTISSPVNIIHLERTNIPNNFYKILQKCTSITEIHIYETILPTIFLQNTYLINFTNTKIIKIFDCKIFGTHTFISSFPNLEHISINIPLYMSQMSFSQYFHILDPLKILSVSYSNHIISQSDTTLLSHFKNLKSLKIISPNFQHCTLTDIFITDFGHNLQELLLIETHIPQPVLHYIFTLHNLHTINLSLSTIHNTKPLILYTSSCLATLIISGINTTYTSYNYILEIFSPSLIFLDFPINYIPYK